MGTQKKLEKSQLQEWKLFQLLQIGMEELWDRYPKSPRNEFLPLAHHMCLCWTCSAEPHRYRALEQIFLDSRSLPCRYCEMYCMPYDHAYQTCTFVQGFKSTTLNVVSYILGKMYDQGKFEFGEQGEINLQPYQMENAVEKW